MSLPSPKHDHARSNRSAFLRQLAQQIQDLEVVHHPADRRGVKLGIPALEKWLPGSELPAGGIVELVSSADGAGAWSLALLMGKHACGQRKAMVIGDIQGNFYPPAAQRLGLDLERLIVVRPKNRRDLGAALDQSLRCPAVGAVIGWCDPLPLPDYRRLQLAAEAGGGAGFFIRPAHAARAASFAFLRLWLAPAPTLEAARRVQVDVLRCRGGKPGPSLLLEIDDETGDVRVPAPVAVATSVARTAGASG